MIRLFIESETVWECPASTDHVGGSFGLIARERAVLINKEELSNIVLAETRIGSCARDPYDQKAKDHKEHLYHYLSLSTRSDTEKNKRFNWQQ